MWQPAWGIRLLLEALISFLPTPADGAIGALDWSPAERRRLAKESVNFVCPICCGGEHQNAKTIADLLPKIDEAKAKSRSSPGFAKEIAELQRLQQINEAVVEANKDQHSDEAGKHEEAEERRNDEDGELAFGEEEQVEKEKGSLKDNLCSDTVGNDEGGENVEDCVELAASKSSPEKTMTTQTAPTPPTSTTLMEDPQTQEELVAEEGAENFQHDNGNLSWLYDPLLNVMMILLTMICYLLMQKYMELRQELNDLQSWDQQYYESAGLDSTKMPRVGGEL